MPKLGGTTQMWTLLSFTGWFDVDALSAAIAKGGETKHPPRMPGERTDKEKAQIRNAAGDVVCEFIRKGGLYVTEMQLRKPSPDANEKNSPAPFGRPGN